MQYYPKYEESGKCDSLSREKTANICQPKITQMLELSQKDFKATIINTLSEKK